MAADNDKAEDPRRSVELLWGRLQPGRRGPKPKLTLEEVLDAAIALCDREGLAALSMRRVAEALGLSPMAIYTYAPSKAALVELMMDRAWGELKTPAVPRTTWREKLEAIGRQMWSLGHEHPWMLEVGPHRPALGPNFVAHLEAGFRALDGLGLHELEMELLLRLVVDYARGAVRTAIEVRQLEQRTGMTDEEWMAATEPALMEVLDPASFPVLHRIGAALRDAYGGVAFDRDQGFEFGLQRVLDGVEAFIDRRRSAGD